MRIVKGDRGRRSRGRELGQTMKISRRSGERVLD